MSVKAHELTEHPEFWAAEINKMNSEIDRLRARLAEIEGQKPDYYARKEEGVDIVSRHGRAMITLATEPDKYMCIPLYAAPVPTIPDESVLKAAYWDFDARVNGYAPYSAPYGQPEHAFVVAVQQAMLAAAPPPEDKE